MDQKFRHFRKFEPSEGHAVMSVQWSRTGDRFLVCPGSAKARIYDRDGFLQGETIKGDMYIRDMTHTFVRGPCEHFFVYGILDSYLITAASWTVI